jgi:hypothetical protein
MAPAVAQAQELCADLTTVIMLTKTTVIILLLANQS